MKTTDKIKLGIKNQLINATFGINENLTDLIDLAKRQRNPQTLHQGFSSLNTYRLIIESTVVLRNYLASNSLLNEEEIIRNKKFIENLTNDLKNLAIVKDEFNNLTKNLLSSHKLAE